MTASQRWMFVLGSAVVLWGVSERAFWSMLRPDENIGILLLGLLPYIITTYFTIWALERYRVTSFAALVLIGALYGWIVEGAMAGTIMGKDGIPFPVTLSWTALAQHLPFAVLIAWYWQHKFFSESFIRSVVLASVCGVVWAVWSMLWWFETPPVIASIPAFAAHAFGVVALMSLGHYLMGRGKGLLWTAPSRREFIVMSVLLGLIFVAFSLPVILVGALVLVGLFYLLHRALGKEAARYESSAVLAVLSRPVPLRNLATIFITPTIATVGYALQHAGLPAPVYLGIPILSGSSVLGLFLFLWALWRVYRPKAVPLPTPSSLG
jgi:hypothetical protein